MANSNTNNGNAPLRRKRRSRLPLIALILVVLLVAAYYVVMGQGGLTQKLAEQKTQEFAENFKRSMEQQGANAEFKYTGVAIEREGLRQQIRISEPAVIVTENTMTTTISTAYAQLLPRSIMLDNFTLRLREPLKMNAANTESAEISFTKPLDVEIDTENSFISGFKAQLPENFSYKHFVGPEATRTLDSFYGVTSENGALSGSMKQDGSTTSSKLSMRNVSVHDKLREKQLAKIEDLNINSKNLDLQDRNRKAEYVFDIKNIFFPDAQNPSGPYSFTSQFSVEGRDLLSKDAQKSLDAESQDPVRMKAVLSSLKFTSKDFTLSGDGQVEIHQEAANSPNTQFIGLGKIVLTDPQYVLDQLVKRGVLGTQQLPAVKALVERVTGKKWEENNPLVLNLKREKDNPLMVGNITADEALAFYMQQAMQGMQGMMPPGVGVPTAPNAAPLEPQTPARPESQDESVQ